MKFFPRLLSCAATLVFPSVLSAQTPVPAPAASHYEAVGKHLETGGVFYAFADVDGDAAKFGGLGDTLIELARTKGGMAVPPGLSATGLLKSFGLDRVKAFGLSSRKAEGTMFHNRAMVHMPEGRSGVFSLLGGPAAPLFSPGFAPAGSDVVMESDLTLSALREFTEAVLTNAGDPQLLQQFQSAMGMTIPLPGLEMKLGDLIAKLDTRLMAAGRIEEGKTFTLPGSQTVLPMFRMVVSLDNLAFLFTPMMEIAKHSGNSIVDSGDGFELIRPSQPLPEELHGFKPVIYHDLKSKRILFGTHVEAVRECLENRQPISGDPVFQQATAGLPKLGNEFSYLTPKVFELILKMVRQSVAGAPPSAAGIHPEILREVLAQMETVMPLPTQPLTGVRANLPEGMVVHANSSSSYKSILMAGPIITLSMFGAVGGGAFDAIRKKGEDARLDASGNDEKQTGEVEPADEEGHPPTPSAET